MTERAKIGGERAFYVDGVECDGAAYSARISIAADRIYSAAYDRSRHPAPPVPEDPEIAIVAIVSVLAALAAASPSMGDWIQASFAKALEEAARAVALPAPPKDPAT